MATLETQPLTTSKIVNFTGAAVVQNEGQSITAEVTPGLVGTLGGKPANGVTDEENSKMQICWNQAMCKEMQIPEGYEKVAVLILKWNKELDQLNSESEVRDLENLFRKDFNYHTEIVELDNFRKPPQMQLNRALINFIFDHNEPNNLLIIYYTGHGEYDEVEGCLKLHASKGYKDPSNLYSAHVCWNRAERPLIEDSDCDVLAIFDTCFASNLQKKGQLNDLRIYEFFAASGHNRPTDAPGAKSFTNALISSLKELLKECGDHPFTTRQLCEKINLNPARLKNPSHVWSRFKRYDRCIALAPLKRTLGKREEDFNRDRTRAFLSLRLPLLVECLTDDQISTMARTFSKAVKDLKAPVKRIDWVGMQSWSRTTSFAGVGNAINSALKWRNRHQQLPGSMRHEAVQRINTSHTQTWDGSSNRQPTPAKSDSEPMLSPNIPRKRRFSEESYSASGSERSEDDEHRKKASYQPTPPSGMESDTAG